MNQEILELVGRLERYAEYLELRDDTVDLEELEDIIRGLYMWMYE